MSGSGDNFSNILLPTAKVAVFVRDKKIREDVESLKSDWRFARVSFDVREGDVDSAIEVYRQSGSPNLVIVETEEIGDVFTGRLEVLAGSCSEDTAAVVVGPVNDVYLYRRLIEMGVSDYLVRPVEKNILVDLISKILVEKLGTPGSRLIAFVGAKGGVGTSTIAQLSASVSADLMGQKTVILDTAGGRSYLSVAMGTESLTTLHEAARASTSGDQDSFRRMIVKVSENLSVLATGAESILDSTIAPEQLDSLVNKLMVTYPVVMVDLSQGPQNLAASIIARAHDVVLVSSSSLPSLRATRGLLQEIKTLRGGAESGIHLLINGRGVAAGYEVGDQEIQAALKISPACVVAWNPKICGAAESTGKKIVDIPAAKELLLQIQKFIAANLHLTGGGEAPEPVAGGSNLLGGLLGKIKQKN